MRLNYQEIIKESETELVKLERQHRFSHLNQRLRMLGLLKSGRCQSIAQVAKELGYSWRHCQRWLRSYRTEGLKGLLENHLHQRGRQAWQNEEAWQALDKALRAAEIARYQDGREVLAEQGVHYQDNSGVLRLFKRHQIKAKTGRYQHEKADLVAQAGFKKNSLTA